MGTNHSRFQTLAFSKFALESLFSLTQKKSYVKLHSMNQCRIFYLEVALEYLYPDLRLDFLQSLRSFKTSRLISMEPGQQMLFYSISSLERNHPKKLRMWEVDYLPLQWKLMVLITQNLHFQCSNSYHVFTSLVFWCRYLVTRHIFLSPLNL